MPDERIRLFVALELPASVSDTLRAWAEGVLAGGKGLRVLNADSLHVTMCFLGWQDADQLARVTAACRELSGADAPRLSVGEPRWLPPRRPRVLAVELIDQRGALAAAQARLSELLAAGGWYEPEKRPYLAHVTVARVSRGDRVARATLPDVPSLEFDARTVTLFRSRLERGGASYEALARIELA